MQQRARPNLGQDCIPDLRGEHVFPLCLFVAGVAHVGAGDGLELIRLQPRGQLRQEPVKCAPAERAEDAVLDRDVDIDLVHRQLEVDRTGRVPRLALVGAPRQVQAHQEPAEGAEEGANQCRQELAGLHL